MNRRCHKLFVYGTLRRGFPLHLRLGKRSVRYLGKGRVRGRLYDLGEFPGALPSSSPHDEIEGEAYELLDGEKQLRELDKVEEFYPDRPDDSLFVRRITDVRLHGGQHVKTWVYFLPKRPVKARTIAGGEYAEVRRSRN